MAIQTASGTAGNERLTANTGALLVALLIVEGVTIFSLSSLLSVHIFVGVLLIPPVLLKLAATGYRFVRYYTGSPEYVSKGPPPLLLRALGPVLVIAAATLLGSGVALLVVGRSDNFVRTVHTLSFLVFAGAVSLHVLGHLRKLLALLAAGRRPRLPGGSTRQALLIASLLAGVAVGTVAVSYDGTWVHHHHHHRFELRNP